MWACATQNHTQNKRGCKHIHIGGHTLWTQSPREPRPVWAAARRHEPSELFMALVVSEECWLLEGIPVTVSQNSGRLLRLCELKLNLTLFRVTHLPPATLWSRFCVGMYIRAAHLFPPWFKKSSVDLDDFLGLTEGQSYWVCQCFYFFLDETFGVIWSFIKEEMFTSIFLGGIGSGSVSNMEVKATEHLRPYKNNFSMELIWWLFPYLDRLNISCKCLWNYFCWVWNKCIGPSPTKITQVVVCKVLFAAGLGPANKCLRFWRHLELMWILILDLDKFQASMLLIVLRYFLCEHVFPKEINLTILGEIRISPLPILILAVVHDLFFFIGRFRILNVVPISSLLA